ncbi:MAG: class I SAM-dependent methyltransferase [Gemmatimonadaceae bacterium]
MIPHAVRSRIKDFLHMPQVERSVALKGEVQFWQNWLSTKGMYWPDDFRARCDPGRPLDGHLAPYIDRVDADCVRILDVGSGPLTKLGKTHPSKRLEITATDLLATDYDRLLAELGIVPPVRTVYADAEQLVAQFGRDAFDIVHAQNCIDHTADPQRAIEQMVAVARPGGYVVLYHAENEGQRERYNQLHQWNFTCEDGAFIIRDRAGRTVNMTHRLAALCDVECRRVGESPSAAREGVDEADVPREARPDAAILTGIHKRVPRDG